MQIFNHCKFSTYQLSCKFSGKRAFIAGVADDNGYGWAIAKALAAAGAEILVGTWVPVSYLICEIHQTRCSHEQ